MPSAKPRRIVVLGSTGSIGTQTLDVVRRLGPDRAAIVGLAARRNEALLREQAAEFAVEHLCLTERDGEDAMISLATLESADTVVVAVAGAAALSATVAAARLGKRLCLATKEVLVAAGDLVMRTVRECGAEILPIDSEHSAIFQCLQGYPKESIAYLHITASGGPFRTWSAERIRAATVEEALNHPTWRMGGKITIDSATLMNKGLEVIEACHLFDLSIDRVRVVVHPQSVVHSFVELTDGALLAQLGLPDMRLPIQIALTYPDKTDIGLPRLLPTQIGTLTFEEPDEERFPALRWARRAFEIGGTAPAVLNAANEEAVGAFLAGRIAFGEICGLVAASLEAHTPVPAEALETIRTADQAGRNFVRASVGTNP
ncbi:MAG: 1-deoxy-D-xylulose-5-phosphate reductoisomerase [Capsulimonadales bacterium]|nr:1-deoxy-D-xylulose-5-phosphate reductoisomerase [Capsulimonadales bacterium]